MLWTLAWSWAVALALASTAAWAQDAAPQPAFEVAAIKPAALPTPGQARSGQFHMGMKVDAARVDIGSMSLADLIRVAYRVKAYHVAGPDWMTSQRFDVLAKLPEGASPDQVPEMLQALLAERFQLRMHRENRERAVYALVAGKNGTKLKESPPETDGAAAPEGAGGGIAIGVGNDQLRVSGRPDGGRGMVIAGGEAGTTRVSMGQGGMMHLETSKMALTGLADLLSRFVDRPVVDMTGLKGRYQVALDLSMEDLRNVARTAGLAMRAPGAGGEAPRQPADAASEPAGTTIFEALQQLGLKLEPRKAPLETIVVDHLEKTPTEN